MITETSLIAYKQIIPELSGRQFEVYNTLLKFGPATNTMISNYLKLPINQITGRTYELRNDKKCVGVAFKDKCLITKRMAIYWKVLK